MTPRERLLAMVVGALVFVVGAAYLANRVSTSFDQRHDRLLTLQTQAGKQKRALTFGVEARREMDHLIRRSLPSDPTLARSLYQSWLLDRAVDTGFESVKVSPQTGRAKGDLYFEHSFVVSGFANLQELTEFLYRFYSVGYLHRIGRLSAKPMQGSRDLDVSLTVDALSLNAAPADKTLDDPPAGRLMHDDLQTYVETIVYRNLFAPANKPPQLASPESLEGNPNRPVAFQARGSDPDPLDTLRYEFADDPPEGARLDPESGEFRWTPSRTGEFEVAIRLTDNGLPPLQDVQRIRIAVVEPRTEAAATPAPSFDPATEAVITGITSIGDAREVWLNIRTEGRVLKLREGDTLHVGSIQGTVHAIRADEAEILTSDGRTVIVRLGKSLVAQDETRDL